ncbi:MAG TPA: hypothetical protein VEI46_11010 [Thermodesulfovibrionales bacterium]|nr:hypothetical protein [Thermodesulfovibrionales bacterium]
MLRYKGGQKVGERALPFTAVGMVLALVGKKVFSSMFNDLGNLVSFRWRPSEAHLAGKGKKHKGMGGDPIKKQELSIDYY